MTLYHLTMEYADLADALEAETDEEYAEELETRLAALGEEIGDKGEGYARLIKNLEAEADGLKAEIDRLSALKKRRENAVERLKGNLLSCMKMVGADKINTSIGKWSVRKNPPSVVILDESRIPDEYLIPQPAKVDKRRILDAYKQGGEIVNGCEIERKESIQFR